ncbi:MAG: hypothetical protein HY833_00420 [Candidatus Aenigmarchaeota archaeon]|nr:hypothetical protein [Candidatus Aenigmarchaeota archaeon]
MKKEIFAAFAAAAFLFLASGLSYADTTLGSGNTSFTVKPIILSEIPFDVDQNQYCGNPDRPQTQNFNLALVGDPNFLNIRWNAKDPGGIERQIGVNCWLNCAADPNQLLSDVNLCAGYQNCSYVGPTGDHSCSIQIPKYNFNAGNNATCRFYDTVLPSQGLVVENRSFYTVDYKVFTPSVSLTVGADATLPVDVKSFGILPGYYTNNLTALQNSQLVFINGPFANTANVRCGENGRTFPTIKFLSSGEIPFLILSRSSVDTTACMVDSECGYLSDGSAPGRCVSNVCWKSYDLSIQAGVASLPEYGIMGFAAIILLASFLFIRKGI